MLDYMYNIMTPCPYFVDTYMCTHILSLPLQCVSCVASLQTKETHLQELLEAKANALFHADRLNSQYRNKMAQIETEVHM